ncbi:hypothetical protein VOLCADRAFT_98502 [Volvox carteri f. nagariensis]|uniref:UDP-N-acetylglucosamine transferase subunit ALG14 n=1 Tax=Volvox carteri f. nagariensis TaxID=3068 RepID=D8UFI3_VOLCA|nr:uncharacterized protein VOLCADRAFT_98502 [Volvox carteri f. nagariensis]EFJ41508.1 hypothetical protein VOLCADRAFT_98502 [Volvox carteri f. nagariensis]|eukprot:XP_002957453.1 hypothetical protein VOLCADRAFT_98502 [Volvox carteri f. nagariensis]
MHFIAGLHSGVLWTWGIALVCVLTLALRVLYVLFQRKPATARTKPAKTLIVLGSGGHSAEMLMLLDKMDKARYSPRSYVVAATDRMSGPKALARERIWQNEDSPTGFNIHHIPRSREVGQSYVTSVITTLYSLVFAFVLVLREVPDLVLVNGPGTCIPICAAAFVYRVFGLMGTRIVYVESIARTRRFSLSAKLLYHLRMADLVFVQWEQLTRTYPRALYAGRLY